MENEHIRLVVDAGNTQVKLVYFQNDEIVNQSRFDATDLDGIEKFIFKNYFTEAILSSVQSDQATELLSNLIHPDLILTQKTRTPISFEEYQTIETLGADRIANAVAASCMSKTENTLVIDIGTCIKYDLIIQDRYQGGGIAPGMKMRFKALHDYTGQLPLLDFERETPLIGKSTKGSMLSGVINGMITEINGIVEQYTQQFQPLTIFLTGGDAKRFDKALKNSIFAEENLTVKGLHLILKHND